MIADGIEMFPIALDKIDESAQMPFPLFVYLMKNHRFVPLRHKGDPLGHTKNKLLHFNLNELYVPDKYYEAIKNLVEIEEKSVEAQVVREAFEQENLPPEIKSEILNAISEDVMNSLNEITAAGDEARAEAMSRCSEIADEILAVAGQYDTIYDEALAIRANEDDLDHSVVVGTISAMFAMAAGITDEIVIADMILAALFHDIGTNKVKEKIRRKVKADRNEYETVEYEKHVSGSIEILTESGKEFPGKILQIIEQHHENYDGSGYPKGLAGNEILDLAQILHLADWFDNLLVGQVTGKELSCSEAFDILYSSIEVGTRVNPELVETIFQYIAEEKESFEKLKEVTEEKVVKIAEDRS